MAIGDSTILPTGAALLAATAALVDLPSVSHEEGALADHLEAELRALPALVVTRVGDNVVARTERAASSRLLLAGHLDTVPPAGNALARLEGDRVHGLGSADMKGGLAVMLRLAAAAGSARPDLTFVFYAREEVARAHSGLLELEAADAALLHADAAVLLEPTAARIEAGCQGIARVAIVLGGRRAHSARPWVGINAIHRLAPVLEAVAAFEERRPVLDGCEYRETLQAVRVEGGVAGNVVPDEARLVLSHRFAPDRGAEEALSALESRFVGLLDPALGDRIETLDLAPPAPPALEHPLLRALLEATGAPPRAKIAWTDVAFFAERGIPATNFGPGDPLLAHRADEFVTAADLEQVYDALASLCGLPAPG